MNLLGKMLGNHTVTLPSGETLGGPYAGVLGWPAQCGQGDARCWPEADRMNLKVPADPQPQSPLHGARPMARRCLAWQEILKGQKETSA